MTREEAKEVLLLYRPGTADAEDAQVEAAMEVARRDPELARWFGQHKAFQSAMRLKFREIEVPEHLKMAVLAGQKVIRPAVWWQQPAWLAVAALFLLLLGLSSVWLKPRVPDQFANYRERMVSTALREYRMDLVTNDMTILRQAIQAKGAPSDYEVTRGLEKLQLTGGAALTWRNHPVAMVCFDRGDRQMLFLFVLKRSAVKDPPPAQPAVTKISELMTASWTKGDKTYLLLGPEDTEFAKKYL
jgi:uncharacterized membrane protein YbaN (DUF454 family)